MKMSLFPSISCITAAFSLNGEYVVRSFLPNGVFLPCDSGWIFDISLLCEIQSINQSNEELFRLPVSIQDYSGFIADIFRHPLFYSRVIRILRN